MTTTTTHPAVDTLLGYIKLRTPAWHSESRLVTAGLVLHGMQCETAHQVMQKLWPALPQSSIESRYRRAGVATPKQQLAAFRLYYLLRLHEAEPAAMISDFSYRMEWSSPQSLGRHIRGRLGLTVREFLASTRAALFLERIDDVVEWDRVEWSWLAPVSGTARRGRPRQRPQLQAS